MHALSEFELYLVRFEVFVDEFPINKASEVLNICSSGVSVVDVIGMFPNINSQERLIVACQRISSVRCVDNGNIVLILCKPSPA